MLYFGLKRRVEELERSVEKLSRQVEAFGLDYQNLYEKVRMNLAKLAKRAESAQESEGVPDPLGEARKELVRRKMRRRI